MKQNLRFLMLALLTAVFSTTWGQDVTLDFTTNSWNLPTSNTSGTHSYTSGNYTINVYGSTAFSWKSSGYFLFGKTDSYIELPAFDFDVEKIVFEGNSAASASTKMNVYVGNVAVSTETIGSQETNTYVIDEDYQAAENVYKIKVTSNHNAQVTKIKIYKKAEQLTGETYELINGTPSSIVEGDYIITCNSSSQKYAMTNVVTSNAFSGTEPTIDGNANVVTDDNTMVWHIAPQGDYWTIQSLSDGMYAASTGSSATMTNTLDDNALWSYNGNNGFVNKANSTQLHFFNGTFSFTTLGSGVFTLYRMPDKYYVAGSWTDWATNKIEMTKNADGTYTLANQELPVDASFKIVKMVSDESDPIWCGGNAEGEYYWVTADNHTDLSLNVGGGQNFQIKSAGTWTFIVDPTGDTPTLTVDGWPEWEYYLYGDFNEWATTASYKFDNVGNGKYTLNKPILFGEKFKIYGIRGSEEKWFGAVSNGDFYVEESWVGTSLSLATPGENFYMNLSNQKDYWELEFDPANMTLVLSNYLSDVAELPFEFDGGRSEIQNTAGLTTTGLGTDYSNSPKLKFTTANNALILHFNEQPGKLTFDIQGNSFSGGTFVVQTSEDGISYTDLKEYTTLGATQNEEFTNLGANVRYIKWLYKEKVNGNVGLGNIKLDEYVAPEYHTLSINPVENAEIFVFYNDPYNNYPEIADGDEVLSGSEVMVSVSADEGFSIKSLTVTDEDGQEVELTEEEMGISWIFTMPKSNVTVTCTVEERNYDIEEWVLTDLADLTEDDIFVIVGFYQNNPYAMINHQDGNSGPATLRGLYITDNREILRGIPDPISDEIKWNVKSDDDGYIFYPNGDNEKYLYATNTNNGMRVGGGDAKHFKLSSDGYLTTTETTDQRYVGIYSGSDWRCYTSINSNIQNQTFGFYKYVKPETFEFSISDLATDGTTCYATISALGNGLWIVKGNVEVSTVVVENNKLTYPFVAKEGDKIPGDGAYLVKGAAGDYAFEKSNSPRTIDIGDNMLMSTGEGDITTSAPADAGNTPYLFYKLTRNANSDVNSVGFYFGAENGAAFTYKKGHQAYLAVPNPNGGTGVQSFSFDGTSTGINGIVTVSNNDNEVYTLSGMRVNSDRLQKGIYIVNGKKVVIK